MADDTPQHQKQTTLAEILEDLDQVGFKMTGKLKALMLCPVGVLKVRVFAVRQGRQDSATP